VVWQTGTCLSNENPTSSDLTCVDFITLGLEEMCDCPWSFQDFFSSDFYVDRRVLVGKLRLIHCFGVDHGDHNPCSELQFPLFKLELERAEGGLTWLPMITNV
jgi:hypothetical protein